MDCEGNCFYHDTTSVSLARGNVFEFSSPDCDTRSTKCPVVRYGDVLVLEIQVLCVDHHNVNDRA
jgi:hypothetical protein